MSWRSRRKSALVKMFDKQRGKCSLCGTQMCLKTGFNHTATIDHVIPKSRLPFGHNGKYNTKAACWKCNTEKANLMPGEKCVPEFF